MSELSTKGLVFPLELSSGAHVISESDDLIKSSIRIILSWPLFTNENEDDFGSRIYEVLEEPNDEVLITLIEKFIIDSLNKWERRIELKKMTFERPSNERLIVDLFYHIKDINIEDTLRYTFYTN